MKALETDTYSIEESERAAGLGSYKKPLKRKIETQPNEERPAKDIRLDLN